MLRFDDIVLLCSVKDGFTQKFDCKSRQVRLIFVALTAYCGTGWLERTPCGNGEKLIAITKQELVIAELKTKRAELE